MGLLTAAILYLHPRALGFWPALGIVLTVSVAGTVVFSRFVFVQVARQEADIARRGRELAEAKEALAVGKERERIARDLHDSVAQRLGYLHLGLARVERQLAAGAPGPVRAELTELKGVAREAYEEARQAIWGLRSMATLSLDLIPILVEYVHDWGRHTGIAVDLEVDRAAAIVLRPTVEIQLLGIIQEAMANIRRHSGARHVVVAVGRDLAGLRVAIRDDGLGFDVAAARKDAGSFGVQMMQERADAVGGELRIESRPGEGTWVEVRLPVGGGGRPGDS